MNIGQAAQASGISAKMIRYYESIDLIGPVRRLANGYRDYTDDDVHVLRFIGKSRDLGFSISAIAELIALWRDKTRASRDVRALATEHIIQLKRRIADMHAMVQTLETLSDNCHGDDRPDCPILDELAAPTSGSE